MIRHAADTDAPALARMAEAFHRAARPALPFDWATAARAARAFISHADGCALVLDRGRGPQGMLIAAVTPSLFGPGRIAVEAAFWIDPEARGGPGALRLLRAYRAWAETRDVTVIGMVSRDARTAAMYRRLGMVPAETHWVWP